VTTSWHAYQRERARCFVVEPSTWTRIEHLAACFQTEPCMDATRVAAILATAPAAAPIVPSGIKWHSSRPAMPSDVVLVWQKPGLTGIVERSRRRLSAGDGEDA
jgi:hypothetical protein